MTIFRLTAWCRIARTVLLVVALLPSLVPAADFTSFKAMVIASFDSYESVMQRIGLGLEAIGAGAYEERIGDAFNRMLMISTVRGLDRFRSGHVFLLTPDPPDSVPIPAVLLPLANADGAQFLEAVESHYSMRQKNGGVHTFARPVAEDLPALLNVAIAESHALISTRIDGVRWLALRQRDRTTPAAAKIDMSLRITADGDLCGLFLQLLAALSEGKNSEVDGDNLSVLSRMMNDLGILLEAFESIDLGFDADIRDISATLRLNAATNTPMAGIIGGLATTGAAGRLLPGGELCGGASCLPALLAALPASTIDWLEALAETTQVAGLRVAPRMTGWLKLLQPALQGEHASALLANPSGRGLCSMQVFGFTDERKARAAFEILTKLMPTKDLRGSEDGFAPGLQPLESRQSGSLVIAGYRFGQSGTSTNRAYIGGIGDMVSEMLGLNTVEMTWHGSNLVIVRGAAATIEVLLKSAAEEGAASPYAVSASGSLGALRHGGTLLGAGQIAPVATLRAMVASMPGGEDQMEGFPLPGGNLNWRATRQGTGSVVVKLQIPASEVVACRRLQSRGSDVFRSLMSQFVLEQFNKAATGREGRDLMRRLRERRAAGEKE